MKKEIIEKCKKEIDGISLERSSSPSDWDWIKTYMMQGVQIAIKHLPDFTYKIDEERMEEILNNIVGLNLYHDHLLRKAVTNEAVKEYNSTLPEGLQPLPKEKELSDILWQEMNKNHKPSDIVYEKLAKFLVKTYGTPEPKPSLPSVPELANEMRDVWMKGTFKEVAQHLHNKYGTPPREWWRELKPLEKFVCKYEKGDPKTLSYVKIVLKDVTGKEYDIGNCTPYTAPTADEIIKKHNLTEEEIKTIKQST